MSLGVFSWRFGQKKGAMRQYQQGFSFTFGRVRKRAFPLRIYFWENLSRKLKLVTQKTEEKPPGIINSNLMSHLYNIYARGWANLLLVDFCDFTDISTYRLPCFVLFVYPYVLGLSSLFWSDPTLFITFCCHLVELYGHYLNKSIYFKNSK